VSIETICGWFGMSRQAWYGQRSRQQAKEIEAKAIVGQVRKLRKNHPRMGVRKLLHHLKGWLVEQGLKMGRDRLFALLRRFDLLVRPKRRRGLAL